MSIEDKIKRHEQGIYTSAVLAAGTGVAGAAVPMADLFGMTAIWGGLMYSIADTCNRQLDKDTCMRVAKLILTGAAAYIGGSRLLGYGLQWILPGIGHGVYASLNSVLNFLYTIRMGRFIAMEMEKSEFNTADFQNIIPDLTAMIFAAPTLTEINNAWHEWNQHK